MRGVEGRIVSKLRILDIGVISKISPDIVILEMGKNDLSNTPTTGVGSDIDDMVQQLISQYSVRAVVLWHVTPRAT